MQGNKRRLQCIAYWYHRIWAYLCGCSAYSESYHRKRQNKGSSPLRAYITAVKVKNDKAVSYKKILTAFSLSKKLLAIKKGSQGRSPRTGRQPFVPLHRAVALCGWLQASLLGLGAVAPVKFPFPWERGQGDRDNKSEVCFQNRFFCIISFADVNNLFSLFNLSWHILQFTV